MTDQFLDEKKGWSDEPVLPLHEEHNEEEYGRFKISKKFIVKVLLCMGFYFFLISPAAFKVPSWAKGLKGVVSDYSYYGKAQQEKSLDVFFKALETNFASNWSKKYTAEPHLAGTNFGLAEWTKEKFEEYGLKSTIDQYEVLLSYPHEQDLRLLDTNTGEQLYRAPLKEDEIEEDETTKGEGLVPTFLGYAANGNVTSSFVYVNYGTKDDFAYLQKLGVDVTGKIVIARYGAIFRGLKVKFAQENGAAGVLLYSDPGDDHGITPAKGFGQYPDGPARQESSVQRGSAQFLGGIGSSPGDPTTPGYASKPGVDRQDPHANIGKIPALPISYREVKPILDKLNGHGTKVSLNNWKGELDGFEYWTGPNEDVQLNLYNNQIYNISTLTNVYGEFEGERKDEAIIIGNHRDAWIKGGAGDPNSGSAVLLEIARALGELKANGFKFKRTIILQSFDGEEYGLLGSTEFGEYASKRLQHNVAAYLNLDSAVVGKQLDLSASPLLNDVLRSAASKLAYPEPGVGTLYDHFVKEGDDKIGILGSGSDYTVFLEHLGIPSADIGFRGGKGDPVYQYHSNYDSYYWMANFADKGFVYHNLMAKYLGLVTLELSQKEVLPFGLNKYAKALKEYFNNAAASVPEEWLNEKVHHKDLRKFYNHDFDDETFVRESSNGHYASPFLPRMGCHRSAMIHHLKDEKPKKLHFGDIHKSQKKNSDQVGHFEATSKAHHTGYNDEEQDVETIEDGNRASQERHEEKTKIKVEKIKPGCHSFDTKKMNKFGKKQAIKKPDVQIYHEKDSEVTQSEHTPSGDTDYHKSSHGKSFHVKDEHHKAKKGHHKDKFHPPHPIEMERKHGNETLRMLLEKTAYDLDSLFNATLDFDAKSEYLQSQYDDDNISWWQRIKLHFQIKKHNKIAQYFERGFLHKKGLHERPWFKHIVYASGRFTGYQGQTLPGLNEALEDKDFGRFVKWLGIVSRAFKRSFYPISSTN
ncbi:Piso0_002414 [Millerozyma farinosa CBS 7064]|uniref:Piso0_002414 protein n=1 Tax=Pichia sorbitophila (strain ATCC MYA-4447 / BCRC 22081 / CBS 7064 / NBRC 10061 / NRRL Y-12695) TaxID=559304 RepID=G8YCJ6_PICSO|nr:Piso0_002414 [Millerozyma farinosa CBS 7064]